MDLSEIIEQIETAIIANGTGAITAEVLNPILLGMVGQINDLTGALEDSTVEGDTIVAMVNTLNEALGEIVSPTIFTGTALPTPVLLPDATTGDYYLQTDGPTIISSYIHNGIGWVSLKNWIDDSGVSEATTWSSQKIKEYLDAVDKLISVGTIDIEAGFAIIPAGAYWRIGGVYYSNAAEVSLPIPAAAAGMYRTDLIVANTSGGFDLVAGVESATYLSPPPPTPGTVAVAPVTVYGADITVTSPEVGIEEAVKKSFYNYIEFPGGGAAAVIPLDFKGRSEIRLVEDTLTTVAGVDLSLITGVTSAEVPYKGKLYILRNLTANPVTLLHASGAADIPFASLGGVDLEMPVNGAIMFSYYPDICPILFKNWETASGGSDIVLAKFFTTGTIVYSDGNWHTFGYPTSFFQANFDNGTSYGAAASPSGTPSVVIPCLNYIPGKKLAKFTWNTDYCDTVDSRISIIKYDVVAGVLVNAREIVNEQIRILGSGVNTQNAEPFTKNKIIFSTTDAVDTPGGAQCSIYFLFLKIAGTTGGGLGASNLYFNFE